MHIPIHLTMGPLAHVLQSYHYQVSYFAAPTKDYGKILPDVLFCLGIIVKTHFK
jgi:hypothetical protein